MSEESENIDKNAIIGGLVCIILIFSMFFVLIDLEDDIVPEKNENNLSSIRFDFDDYMESFSFYNQSFFSVDLIDSLQMDGSGVAIADFDGDGVLDFVVASSYSNSYLTLYSKNKNGSYGKEVLHVESNDINGISADDFDGDGDIDIVFTSGEYQYVNGTPIRINGTLYLLKNTGNLSFQKSLIAKRSTGIPRDSEGRINPRVSSLDFDGDSDMDLVVGDNSGKVELYANGGNASFASCGIMDDFGSLSWGLTSLDIECDGDMDIVVSSIVKDNPAEGSIVVKINQDKYNSFFEENDSVILVDCHHYPAVCTLCSFDYQSDGDSDLIIASTIVLYLLENDNGTFVKHCLGHPDVFNTSYDSMHNGGLDAGDLNDDGIDDFVLVTGLGEVLVFSGYDE